MKKLRLTALILALILVLSSCSFVDGLFGKNEEPEAPQSDLAEDEIRLSDYKIVQSRYFSTPMAEGVAEFGATLEAATGVKMMKTVDKEIKDVDNDDPEIVLGPTSRVQSAAALEKLEGRSGFVIARIGSKIIINGTSDYMVLLGMRQFITSRLKGDRLAEGILTVAKDYSAKKSVGTLYIDGATKTPEFSVVCSDALDHDGKSIYGSTPTFTGNDYLYDKAFELRNQLIVKTGQSDKFTVSAGAIAGKSVDKIPATILVPRQDRHGENYEELKEKLPAILQNLNDIIPFYTDETTDENRIEILFGDTNRDLSQTLKNNLAHSEYGILCNASSIALGGWTQATVMEAWNFLFGEASTMCREYDSGMVRIPTNTVLKNAFSVLAEDIPEFTAGRFEGADTSGSGSISKTTASGTLLEYFEKVPYQEYEAYLNTLTAKGYTQIAANETVNSDTGRKNDYRTFTGNGNMIHIYYIATSATEGNVRLISAKLANINLPNNKEETYTKVTETKVTQMRLAYSTGNFGMCYIVTLEDGSFIIFDGGGDATNGVQSYDQVRLYTVLTGLYQDIFGHKPTAEQPITIAAWILTHQHWDHYANFSLFCKTYCKGEGALIKIEQYICNLGSAGSIYNAMNPGTYGINSIASVSEVCLYPFKIVEAHTGQKIYVRNVMIEVLYTQEDLFPLPIAYFNNTSMVTRFHMRRSDGNGQYLPDEKTVLFLGDLHYQGDLAMQKMYGSEKKDTAFLKSDIAQVAHHGWQGCSQELYDVIDAKILLWPAAQSAYSGGLIKGNASIPANGKTYNYKAINRWLQSQNGTRWVILVADGENYTLDFCKFTNSEKTLAQLLASGAVSTTVVPAGKDVYKP